MKFEETAIIFEQIIQQRSILNFNQAMNNDTKNL